jgi:LysR family transcriptional activator of nhaA
LALEEDLRLVCWDGPLETLLADLAVHRQDLVISDHPIPTGLSVKAYTHMLGESGVSFFADPRLARAYERRFPISLDQAPVLLPVNASALRRRLDDWFEQNSIRPTIMAEFEDSALLKAFGEAGIGLFPAHTAIAAKVESMYSSSRVGDVDGVHETYYAISPERKIKHPAILSITESAREHLFS